MDGAERDAGDNVHRARISRIYRSSDLFADAPPSFAPLEGTGEGHIGVIDVGSNSIRLVVFEGGGRSAMPVHNEKAVCGLGTGLPETGRLNPEGREKALVALTRFAMLAGAMELDALTGVATSAMRDAEDGREFRDEIEQRTGIRLAIISGEEEARLAGMGVIFGHPDAEGVVADLGGSSLELCNIGGGKAPSGVSVPLGPLRFMDRKGGFDKAALRAATREKLRPLAKEFSVKGGTLHLVGGACRAVARVHMWRSGYPVSVIHEYETGGKELAETAGWITSASEAELSAVPGLSSSRAATLPAGAAILREAIGVLGPERVMACGFGLREGVCFAHMPDEIRARDPLVDACRAQEDRRARFPGFGAEIAEFLLGFLRPQEAEEVRLIRAVSHLVDVNWRTHPDYRASACVESVTRMQVTGAGHHGRAFMAAALLGRHKGGKKIAADEQMLSLLDPETRAKADTVGRAIRLGTTLSGSARGILPMCTLEPRGEALVLEVAPDIEALVTGDVERRLASIAQPLDLPWEVSVKQGA